MREQYIVTVDRPKGVSVREMRSYIAEAVATWAKGGDPDGELFWMDGDKVRVRRLRKEEESC